MRSSTPIPSTTHKLARRVTTDSGQVFELHFDPQHYAAALARIQQLSHKQQINTITKTPSANGASLQSENTA